MVGLGGTSTCDTTTPRLPQCLLALCWTDPCPRCTYGDKLCRKCRNWCSVYEQTAFVRDIWELKLQIEFRSLDWKTYLTGNNATRRLEDSAPIASPMSGRSPSLEPATPERGLVYRYPILESIIYSRQYVRSNIHQWQTHHSIPVDLESQGRASLNRIRRQCRHSGHAVVHWCSGSYRTAHWLHEKSQQTEDQTETLRNRAIQSGLCCRTGNRRTQETLEEPHA